jgi:Aspartyl protease
MESAMAAKETMITVEAETLTIIPRAKVDLVRLRGWRVHSMQAFNWFARFIFAATAVFGLSAETNCPGNVAGVPYRLANRHQMIVAVSINHSGPYDFLLDTGTQITILDPSLAADLHLSAENQANVLSVGVQGAASFTQLNLIETGSHSVPTTRVLVYSLQNLPISSLPVRGVLGEDFLEHFDMLLDNAHKLLCLDDTGHLRSTVRGAHIPLLTAPRTSENGSLPTPLLVLAQLSDGIRPVILELDSGSNIPFLYDADEYLGLGLVRTGMFVGSGTNTARRYYAALPPQKIRVGSIEIPGVTFVTVNTMHKNHRIADFEGLLPLGIFRRVFIEHSNHFVILESW